MMSLCCDVLNLLKGKTLVTAESCTVGGIGAALTAVSGSSAVYKGGIISYTNWVKHHLLDVPQEVLDTYGAVCAPVAEAMARGARENLQADVAVSVTGIAGPDGATYDKPVGLVYIAATNGKDFICSANRFFGDRHDVRLASVNAMFRDAIRLIGGF